MTRIVYIFTSLLLLSAPLCFAQNGSGSASAAELLESERRAEILVTERALTGFQPGFARTPLEAVVGIRDAIKRGSFTEAASYLDLRYLSDEVAERDPKQLVRGLAFVWTQQNVINLTTISDLPEGDINDDLPHYRDQIGAVTLRQEVVPVYLQRVPGDDNEKVWRFSNTTVERIPDMWAELGYSPAVVWVGNFMPLFDILGMQNWQFTLIVLALVINWFLAGFFARVLCYFSLKIPNDFPSGIQRFWAIPARLVIYLLLMRVVISQLGLSLMTQVYLQSSGVDYIVITIAIAGTITLLRDYKIRELEAKGDLQYIALLKPLTVIVKILVFITAILMWASHAGFNVSTIIAGLGVGSLAVALAAQKTLENVIGAITLYSARPVSPGDFCRFGNITGTVEEIGLRSVTLRTPDRTLITIPNAMFSAADIENISDRDRIRYYKHLQLQMPTSAQLQVILGELRAMFAAHAKVLQDTVSIRLENIEAATAVVRIEAGIMTQDFQIYLAIAEDLNLRIIELVHHNGAIFSGPGQVLQVRDFHQASEEKMLEVNSKLTDWNDDKNLPFPDLSAEEKLRIKGSIKYPPPGSATD